MNAASRTATRPRPRRRYGQNFLCDRAVAERIVAALDPTPADHILEIGPGRGALTRLLAASGARLDCIEIDRNLSAALASEFAGCDRVTVHQGDVLRWDIPALGHAGGRGRLRVIGNLPYNISTPVLFRLLRYTAVIEEMLFMLQHEVVERMVAPAGSRHSGRLSLTLAYRCATEALFQVPPGAFSPRPKVMSAVARLRPHRTLPCPAKDENTLAAVLRVAFSARRKTLRNSLRTIASEDLLETLPVDLSLRPERWRLADFVRVSDAVYDRSR